MTKPLRFTQASLRRAIAAAKASGLRVTGIAPDGTVLVCSGENQPDLVPAGQVADQNAEAADCWGQVEA